MTARVSARTPAPAAALSFVWVRQSWNRTTLMFVLTAPVPTYVRTLVPRRAARHASRHAPQPAAMPAKEMPSSRTPVTVTVLERVRTLVMPLVPTTA